MIVSVFSVFLDFCLQTLCNVHVFKFLLKPYYYVSRQPTLNTKHCRNQCKLRVTHRNIIDISLTIVVSRSLLFEC